MDYDGVLQTYIEVGVAFAGFAALVTVVRRKGSEEIEPQLARRLRYMIETALLAALFSVIALSIRAFGVSDDVSWRISSGLLAVAWSFQTFFGLRRVRRNQRAGYSWGSAPFRYFLLTLGYASIAALAANSLDVFAPVQGPVFILVLGILLFIAGLSFVRFIAETIPE